MIPGLENKDLEIFSTPENVYFISAGNLYNLQNIPSGLRRRIANIIDDKAREAMAEMGIVRSLWFEQFCRCRFGRIDSIPDFAEEGFVNPEMVECERRGRCSSEGKLCLSKLPGLTRMETRFAMLVKQDLPDKMIADKLQISINTATTHRQNIERKLEVPSKVGIANFVNKHQGL